ncbi:MAG: ATP-binding protein [Chitinispirillaceae bacterium]|nr:ATP-binding protein [Chitinispirillaceae bacterium]
MKSEANSDAVDFSAELAYLERMLGHIKGYALKAGFSEQEIYDVQLGCEEVLNNIIHYAYPGKNGFISIRCVLNSNSYRLAVTICDKGSAFNPLSVPEPDIAVPVEQRRIGGLGIYFLRKMFDSIEYERIDSVNRLTLYKK